MSFFQRAATLVFSLLLHGFIAIAGFFFASTEILPEEKAYRVSLAEFAPAQTSMLRDRKKRQLQHLRNLNLKCRLASGAGSRPDSAQTGTGSSCETSDSLAPQA